MSARKLLLFLLVVLPAFHALEISVQKNATLITKVTSINLEGLTFPKREADPTQIANITFLVKNVTDPGDLSFVWKHADNELPVGLNTGRSGDEYMTQEFLSAEHELTVTLHLTRDALSPGAYFVDVSDETKTASAIGYLLSPPILPTFPKPKRVLEGDDARLLCQVKGYPKASAVTWMFSSVAVSLIEDDSTLIQAMKEIKDLHVNTTRFILETSPDGTLNDTLRFIDLANEDNGIYKCSVTIGSDSDTTIILINVKDRWAAFWPFIGIIGEVTILVIGILLYERHQVRPSKSKDAKVDNAPTQPDNASAPGNALPHDSDQTESASPDDVRQRETTVC